MDYKFKSGDAVEYVGFISQTSGARGTVVRNSRNGWVTVDFGGTHGRYSPINLKPVN